MGRPAALAPAALPLKLIKCNFSSIMGRHAPNRMASDFRTLVNLLAQGCDLVKPITLFTAALLLRFYIPFFMKQLGARKKAAFHIANWGIHQVRTLPTRSGYCLGARFVLEWLHITSCLRLWPHATQKAVSKRNFLINLFRVTQKQYLPSLAVCWIWRGEKMPP